MVCAASVGVAVSFACGQAPRGLDLDNPVVVQGLEAWRSADGLTGAACVNCHTPDGFDLAFIDFSDDDIRRRASPHVSPDQAEHIVALVRYLRDRYQIAEPKDPETFRPFQPGGAPLPTAEDTHSHRDAAFAASLVDRGFPLVRPGEYVSHPTQADELFAELHAIDPRTVRLGMRLNRWSEDIADGPEHGLIADWMSEQGRIPSSLSAADALYAAHDAYLAEPSWENFWAYYLVTKDMTDAAPGPGSNKLSTEKHLSAQIAGHLFRLEAEGLPGFLDQPRMAFDTPGSPFWEDDRVFMVRLPNPMWEVGDGVRVFDGRDEFDYSGLALLSINGDMPWKEQIEATRVPWFVTGWLFNPTLQRISGSNSTKSGEYLSDRGFQDFDSDMPTHISYLMHLKIVNEVLEPRAVNKESDIGQPKSWKPMLSNFTRRIRVAYDPGRRIGVGNPSRSRVEFVDDAHEDAFVRFSVNGHRMLLYRFRTELRARGNFTNLEPDDRGIGWMAEFLDKADPDGDHDRLFAAIRSLLSGAPYRAADLTFDGIADLSDIDVFIRDFLAGDEHADLNGDRVVDLDDIDAFIVSFTGS